MYVCVRTMGLKRDCYMNSKCMNVMSQDVCVVHNRIGTRLESTSMLVLSQQHITLH